MERSLRRRAVRILACALVAGALPLGAAAAQAATLYVNNDVPGYAGSLPGCTASAPAPHATVSDAVAAAASGDTIVICASTQTYAGGVTWSSMTLTFRGEGADRSRLVGGGGHILYGSTASSSPDSSVHVEGLRLSDGIDAFAGGAIEVTGNVTVVDCVLDGNRAVRFPGGAIYAAGDVTVTGSQLSNNSAEGGNGGAIAASGTITVRDSTLTANRASVAGGAIAGNGAVTVEDSTVTGNEADLGNGGAIATGGTVTVTNSTFSANEAAGSGGAIRGSTIVAVTDSTFTANSAIGGGGALSSGGAMTATDSTLTANVTGGAGGALSSASTITVTRSTLNANSGGSPALYAEGTTTITNSTIANNRGGGAIAVIGADLTITSSTISGNADNTYQYTITNNQTVTVTNSIIAEQATATSPSNLYACDFTSQPINGGGNIIATTARGCDDLRTTPVALDAIGLLPLADNGGPTPTMALAFDAPPEGAGASCPAVDQRGITRTGACTAGAWQRTTYTLRVERTGTGAGAVGSSSVPSQTDQIACGATCAATYPENTVVTLRAQAAEDSTAGGFTGGCVASGDTCAATMTGNLAVTADFAARTKSPDPTPTPQAAVTLEGDPQLVLGGTAIRLRVRTSGAGTLTVRGTRTARMAARTRSATVCSARRTISRARLVTVLCPVGASTRSARLRGPVRVTLVVGFRATDGTTARASDRITLPRLVPRPPAPVTG